MFVNCLDEESENELFKNSPHPARERNKELSFFTIHGGIDFLDSANHNLSHTKSKTILCPHMCCILIIEFTRYWFETSLTAPFEPMPVSVQSISNKSWLSHM